VSDDIEIREASDADLDSILDVCGRALGWKNPEFDHSLFRWKHIHNTFGRSMLLVACDESGILAVRAFMRWSFTDGTNTVAAARAVDTATRPDAQGRGLFRRLTTDGLARLTDEGVGFVFNTPNDKSLPGYLKMGWVDAGSVQLGFGVRSARPLPRLARSRVAANKPSIETPELGLTVDSGLELSTAWHSPAISLGGLRTAHSTETLSWRFSAGPVSYRFLPGPDDTGLVVRLRQRGSTRELVLAQVIGSMDNKDASRILRRGMKDVSADVCIAPAGFPRTMTVPKLGPTLALRTVNHAPKADNFSWQPGDIELF
jgi:hypothetical protein